MSDDQREAAEAGWREAADDAVYDHRNRPFTVELLKAWFGSGVDVGWDAAMAAKAEPVQIDAEAKAKAVVTAWLDAGNYPQYHEYQKARLLDVWPSLYIAVNNLAIIMKGA